jgi:hypothetical protein
MSNLNKTGRTVTSNLSTQPRLQQGRTYSSSQAVPPSKFDKSIALIIILSMLQIASLTYITLKNPVESEAHLVGFNPSNIISDYVMGNKDTMNVQQIQAFLQSKNDCNVSQNRADIVANRNSGRIYHYANGYVLCIWNDNFNGRSAAQVIYDTAQAYSINPQVLIVLLEKESALITDTNPNYNWQYNTAAGFGCPDTAACDSKYFGLANQLANAANLFRTVLNGGWTNYPVGVNYVQYNPNAACGGTNLNIQNRATSALYRYTPYQPNPSALAAGTGTGDGCASYGNRNFYHYMTAWFNGGGVEPVPNAVWRLYNRSTGAHFWSGNVNEVNALINQGWSYEGIPFYSSPETTIPVYRLYAYGQHFFTTNLLEKNALASSGWNYEGIAWYARQDQDLYRMNTASGHFYTTSLDEVFYVVKTGGSYEGLMAQNVTLTYKPVYRLWGNEHFYTLNITEVINCVKFGYSYEGVAFKASLTTTQKPVYRLWGGEHFYTTSINEYDYLRTHGYSGEGVAFYSSDTVTSKPVFRLWGSEHFYTTSDPERQYLSKNSWSYEGIGWYGIE